MRVEKVVGRESERILRSEKPARRTGTGARNRMGSTIGRVSFRDPDEGQERNGGRAGGVGERQKEEIKRWGGQTGEGPIWACPECYTACFWKRDTCMNCRATRMGGVGRKRER